MLLVVTGAACRKKNPPRPAPLDIPADGGPREPRGEVPSSFQELAARVVPSVVSVRPVALKAPPGPAPAASGSGVILDREGWILTSDALLGAADGARVTLRDGRELGARVAGRDDRTGIALLKVQPIDGLVPAQLGDSDQLEVGEWVVAIGSPFGLEHTVTQGIVSAKGRTWRDLSSVAVSQSYWSFIQTDASINPGNAGGPLVDMHGFVVGVNTEEPQAGPGIGFAIPINMVKALLPMLKKEGRVQRSWLGVFIHPVTPEIARRLGMDAPRGALLSDVIDGSPSAKAGLQPGDVILSFDGKPVDDQSLPWIASTTPPGTRVAVVIWREGRERILTLTPAPMPD